MADGGNTGDGTFAATPTTGAKAREGTYTLTITAAAADAGTFRLTDPDGRVVGTGTVGVAFAGSHLNFTLQDGAADFIVGDSFTIRVDHQLAPGSIIPSTVIHKHILNLRGVGRVRARVKVTGSTGKLNLKPLLADGSTVAGTKLPSQVNLADGVENVIDLNDIAGEELAELSINADGGGPLTVAYVDVYVQAANVFSAT